MITLAWQDNRWSFAIEVTLKRKDLCLLSCQCCITAPYVTSCDGWFFTLFRHKIPHVTYCKFNLGTSNQLASQDEHARVLCDLSARVHPLPAIGGKNYTCQGYNFIHFVVTVTAQQLYVLSIWGTCGITNPLLLTGWKPFWSFGGGEDIQRTIKLVRSNSSLLNFLSLYSHFVKMSHLWIHCPWSLDWSYFELNICWITVPIKQLFNVDTRQK